ncbi:MAG: DUF4837 family protein [Bacteroidales bacterium]|nr:DUF4837 family protein [Bacteroidales bacterium]MBQ5979384.1 DUF4837 family protein [Bacteroidales bacterium]MBQ6186219.1 DUF4837 family protein [Bacteroidales bacterium]
MKTFFKFAAMAVMVVAAISCKSSGKALLPNVSGKAGEVIVVIDRDSWEGNLGNEVRGLLARDVEFLPQREPLYSLVNLAPGSFTDMFKYHRNIVIFNIDTTVQKQGVVYRTDVWAKPQCVIQLNATCADSAIVVLQKNGENMTGAIEQAERNRVIANTLLYEETPLSLVVEEMIGGKVHFPMGYTLKKKTDDFIWIADEKQYTTQGIFIYKYPVTEEDPFTEEHIIAHRDAFLKNYVPGMFDNTYMITSQYITPGVKFLRYHDLDFAETRGLWEVYNDFMGGPFVSHSFYSKDGKDIIVLEAWVYAAKYDKRQYMRQTESLLYSFEWSKDESVQN